MYSSFAISKLKEIVYGAMAQSNPFVKSHPMASTDKSTKVEVVKLDAPTGLSYVEATENTITISWNPVNRSSSMRDFNS